MIGADLVKKTVADEDSRSSFKPGIPKGKHKLTLVGITNEQSKADKGEMVVLELKLDDEHNTFKEFHKLTKVASDIPKEKLIRFFYRGFAYQIKPADDMAGLMKQLVKFQGETLCVAVKGKEKLLEKKENGIDTLKKIEVPELWYVGKIDEWDNFNVDESKLSMVLSDDDKDRLVKFTELNPTATAPATAPDPPAPVVKTPAVEAPAKEEPAKKEPVPATEPQKVEVAESTPSTTVPPAAEEAEDDFPF